MKRIVIGLCVLLLLSSYGFAQSPGPSMAYGKSLTEWMTGYWTWFLGGSSSDGDKNVKYLPLPAGEQVDDDPLTFEGELDVDWQVGDAFALPMFFWIGEEYEDGSQDDPDDIPDDVFTGATVEIMLDGQVILDSDDLGDYLIETTWFDEPIEYDPPTNYGAVAAVWMKGIGFVHPPLSRGSHTLHLYVYSPDFNLVFDNTWNFTVTN